MTGGSKRNRTIYNTLRALKVGEELTIKRSEWKAQTLPSATLRAPVHKDQFEVRWLDDRNGWRVVRVKEAPTRQQLHGPIESRAFYERIRSLRVGEKFTLAKSEWRVATTPVEAMSGNARYRDQIVVEELEDGGWIIARVKEAP
jgi:hypothetical protein